jgi:hypothetical protein
MARHNFFHSHKEICSHGPHEYKFISNDFSMLGNVEDEGITKWRLAWDYISQLKTLKNWKVFEPCPYTN